MKLRTQIFLGYFLILTFMVILAGLTYSSITSLIESNSWVSHTYGTISEMRTITKSLVDMETGERGFLITGKDDFLEPYYDGEEVFEKTIKNLKVLVSDNPEQVKRLEEIEALGEKWQRIAAGPEMEARRRMNRQEGSMAEVATMIAKPINMAHLKSSVKIVLGQKTTEAQKK